MKRQNNQPQQIHFERQTRANSTYTVFRAGGLAVVAVVVIAWVMPFYTFILLGVLVGFVGFSVGAIALVKVANGAGILLLKWQDYQMAKAKIAQAQNNALIIVTPTGTYISPKMKDWGYIPRTLTERREQQALLPATV